jgi:hypothetical protein
MQQTSAGSICKQASAHDCAGSALRGSSSSVVNSKTTKQTPSSKQSAHKAPTCYCQHRDTSVTASGASPAHAALPNSLPWLAL